MRDQVPGDIAVESPGIPVNRPTQGPGDRGGPFESGQPQTRRPLGNIVEGGARFGLDAGRFGLRRISPSVPG